MAAKYVWSLGGENFLEEFPAIHGYRSVMKPRICFLLNKVEEFDFETLVNRYLPPERFKIEILDTFPACSEYYQLIVLWNYQKIIKNAEHFSNVVVMHSSNLPEGRGWAPVYYSFAEQQPEYVISGIFAADKVDTGDVIVRASFPMKAGYTAPFIRRVDNEISLLLISKILEKWPLGNIKAIKQSGMATYRNRRCSQDNEVQINKSLEELVPHLRGVEPNHPAFFFYNGHKFLIEIYPEPSPDFPKYVKIQFPGLNQIEIWNRADS